MSNFPFFLIVTTLIFSLNKLQAQSDITQDTSNAIQLIQKAESLLDQSALPEALQAATEAKALLDRHLGQDATLLGHYALLMGSIYQMNGMVDSAEIFMLRSIDIFSKNLGQNASRTGDAWSNLGTLFFETGRFDQALEAHQKALDIRRQTVGENHEKTGQSYQNMALPLLRTGKNTEAISANENAIRIFQTANGDQRKRLMECYSNFTPIYQELGDYDRAIGFAQKSIDLSNEIFGIDHLSSANDYSNIAICLAEKNDFIKALENLERALTIRKRNFGENHPALIPMYANTGQVHSMQGNFDQAIQYVLKADAIAQSTMGPDHPTSLYLKDLLGTFYTQLGEPASAIPLHQIALEKGNVILGAESLEQCYVLVNLGFAYASMPKTDTALAYFHTALGIMEPIYGAGSPALAQLYNNIGHANLRLGKYETAVEWLQKANTGWQQAFGPIHIDVAKTYKQLGIAAGQTGQDEKAADFFDLAARSLGYDPKQPNSLNSVISLPQLAQIRGEAARLSLIKYQSKGIKTDLEAGFRLAEQAIVILKSAFDQLRTEYARQHLSAVSAPLIETCLQIAEAYGQAINPSEAVAKAFEWMEAGKATFLYEAMQEQNALRFSGIPETLLQREYQLKTEIAYLQKRNYQAGSTGNDQVVNENNKRLFDLQTDYQSLKKQLETQFPDYYRLKYRSADISAQKARAFLTPEQSILSYFVGDSNIYMLTLQKESGRLMAVAKDFPLNTLIEQVRTGITGYHLSPKQTPALRAAGNAQYRQAAQQLYDRLIAPCVNETRQEIIIIPEGPLGYLPFEALLASEPGQINRFSTYPFWGKSKMVRYCYSVALLIEMKEKQHATTPDNNHSFAGFAPWYLNSIDSLERALGLRNDDILTPMRGLIELGDLDSLGYSGEEVLRILEKFQGKGQKWIGMEAKKSVFLQNAPDYQILHLSTHGLASDQSADDAFLVFAPRKDSLENELLFIRDIYNLNLNADMVVLSACQTGTGKLRKGEGIISLARAFAFAGAKSVVSTLWSVNDARTKDFMLTFYGYLLEGKSRTTALFLTKQSFMEKSNDYADPFYWSSFLLIGDGG